MEKVLERKGDILFSKLKTHFTGMNSSEHLCAKGCDLSQKKKKKKWQKASGGGTDTATRAGAYNEAAQIARLNGTMNFI